MVIDMNLRIKKNLWLLVGLIFLVGFGIELSPFNVRGGGNLLLSIICLINAYNTYKKMKEAN